MPTSYHCPLLVRYNQKQKTASRGNRKWNRYEYSVSVILACDRECYTITHNHVLRPYAGQNPICIHSKSDAITEKGGGGGRKVTRGLPGHQKKRKIKGYCATDIQSDTS